MPLLTGRRWSSSASGLGALAGGSTVASQAMAPSITLQDRRKRPPPDTVTTSVMGEVRTLAETTMTREMPVVWFRVD